MLTRNGRPIRCLLVGYNGTGNTGSDVRLLSVIDDVRDTFGATAPITVVTLDRGRTEAMLPAGCGVQVVEISFVPHRYMPAIWRLASQHDVTFLVEGSTFKQNWSVWLLHSYLWASKCARWTGNHCVAYAVDAGVLSGIHAAEVRWVCNRMALIITRTNVARQRLLDVGVQKPIRVNTDTAFRYQSHQARRTSGRRVVGIAPIEFFHWPVRLKLWCRADERYRWPFAFTWNAERRRLSQTMLERWIGLTRHAIERHDLDVQLIAMEDLDLPVCERILAALGPAANGRVTIASSRQYPPQTMVPLLRSLDYLVTSRYHACVLSMAGAVPQMAIAHDERLASIYEEIGLHHDFLLEYTQPDLSEKLLRMFDRLIESGSTLAQCLRTKHDEYFLPVCSRNREDMRAWAEQNFETHSLG